MSALERMKEAIAEALMNSRGWDELSKETSAIEWNPERDDSQYSMVKEDVDFVVDEFIERLADSDGDEPLEEGEEEEESIFDEWGHIRRKQTNTTTATLYVFMDAGTGNARYVSDVREWLANIDSIGVSDDTEVEGFLHLCYDVDLRNVEKIECLECESKDDILLTTHKCKESE